MSDGDSGAPASPHVEELRPSPAPEDVLRALAHLPRVIFLDSAAATDPQSRFSYLAAAPFEWIEKRGDRVLCFLPEDAASLLSDLRLAAESAASPIRALGQRLEPWRSDQVPELPPFQGGAMGLLGYGLSRAFERIAAPRFDEFGSPDLAMGLYDWVIAFDHRRGTSHLISHGFPERDGARRLERAARRARDIRALLGASAASHATRARDGDRLGAADLAPSWPVGGKRLLSNFSPAGYVEAVARAIEYIHAGDIFQVNLSQRFLHEMTSPPLEFYSRLRARNPAPFGAYFDIGGHVIASSSPEHFLTLAGRDVVTRPIKGTRSRGYTPEEDSYRRVDLAESEKDRAENIMIVDLLRNDLSRVSEPHSVAVPRLFELERHPTVHHLVSEVRSRLAAGRTAIDLLEASFPGGSITGAPKVRAMEIIAELEPTARGAYCGSLAWIGFHGDLGANILIRTVTLSRGWMQLPAGGGIVADSRPQSEYQETLDKAAGMLRAIE